MTDQAKNPATSRGQTPVWSWVGRLVIAFCLLLFAWVFWQHAHSIQRFDWAFHWHWLISAVIVEVLAMFLLPTSSLVLLRACHCRLQWHTMVWIYFSSQIAKYLPGGFWGFVGRGVLYKQHGIRMTVGAVCVFAELLLILASASVVGSPALFSILPLPLAISMTCMIVAATAFLLCKPLLLCKVLSRLPWAGKYVSYDVFFEGHRWTLATVFTLYCIFWLLCGLSLKLMLMGLMNTSCPLMHCVVFFAGAWIVGFLSLVTPGGFGVREGALMLLLQAYYPLEIAAALVILARLQWMACEASALGVSYLAQHRFR